MARNISLKQPQKRRTSECVWAVGTLTYSTQMYLRSGAGL